MLLTRRNPILTLMLAILLIIYTAGLFNVVFILVGGQELDPEIWRLESLPAYSIVFTLGDVSALASLRWKKLGLQGLLVTVLFSGILYLLLGPPFPIDGWTFPIILIIVAVFLSLLIGINHKEFFTTV